MASVALRDCRAVGARLSSLIAHNGEGEGEIACGLWWCAGRLWEWWIRCFRRSRRAGRGVWMRVGHNHSGPLSWWATMIVGAGGFGGGLGTGHEQCECERGDARQCIASLYR
jgi:hypothetical protein